MNQISEDHKQQQKVMVISDVHLKSDQGIRHELLIGLTREAARLEADTFVLLGDIFDFCFGAGPYFREKFCRLGAALTQLSACGTRVIFFQGNHEFHLPDLRWEGVEFVTRRELSLPLGGDSMLHLTHGDRIGAPWHYLFYSALSRSFLFRWGGLMLPGQRLDALCLGISGRSRVRSEGKRLNHRAVLNSLNLWLEGCAARSKGGRHIGISGHFHVPWDVSGKGSKQMRLLCLKSWDHPNYLLLNGYSVSRYECRSGSRVFVEIVNDDG